MYLRSCQKNWQWASYWGWFNKNYTFPCPDFHSSHRQHKNGLFHSPCLILLHCGQSKETTLQCCWGRPRERPRAGTTGKGGAGGCAERKGDSIWARSEGGGYDVRMLGKDRNVVSNAGALWLKSQKSVGKGMSQSLQEALKNSWRDGLGTDFGGWWRAAERLAFFWKWALESSCPVSQVWWLVRVRKPQCEVSIPFFMNLAHVHCSAGLDHKT